MPALYVSQNDMSGEIEILNATTDHCRHDLFRLILNRHGTTEHSPYKSRQELSSTSCESRCLCVRCTFSGAAVCRSRAPAISVSRLQVCVWLHSPSLKPPAVILIVEGWSQRSTSQLPSSAAVGSLVMHVIQTTQF